MPESPEELLKGLLPPEAVACYSGALPADAELLSEEAVATGGMVKKRLEEFTHGRFCARRALSQLGYKTAAIPKATDRSPVWPAGIVGSISHSGPVAAAAVAPAESLEGLGLDIEPANPLTDDLIKMICRPDEGPVSGETAKQYFCCKEAVYKCIYPLIQEFVDFQEMQLHPDSDRGVFTATAHSDKFDTRIVDRLSGTYAVSNGLVFATAWIRSGD